MTMLADVPLAVPLLPLRLALEAQKKGCVAAGWGGEGRGVRVRMRGRVVVVRRGGEGGGARHGV